MSKEFNRVRVRTPKSTFIDLGNDLAYTAKGGELLPIYLEECLPGDSFKIGNELMVRTAPMIAPPMQRIDAFVHYYFVPRRILWADQQNEELFSTGGEPDGHPDPIMPYFVVDSDTVAGWRKLANYLGIPKIPAAEATATKINAMPFAAYNKIFNDYYRDQNLMNPLLDKLTAAEQDPVFFNVKNRCWQQDYFTTALPWAQKGAPVKVPVNIILKDQWKDTGIPSLVDEDGLATAGDHNLIQEETAGVNNIATDNHPTTELAYNPRGTLVNDTTIQDLDKAKALQTWLQRLAIGGSRLVEYLKNVWGVKSSDARLQRAEYICGMAAPIKISDVLNTAGISGELPQGNMAGKGLSITGGNVGHYYCEEAGYIIGIASIMPRPSYQDGIPKTFLKFDRYDFAIPDFAHIGEQEVKMEEVLAFTTKRDKTFGYQARNAEYRCHPSRTCGEFTTSLDYWRLTRQFPWDPDGEVPLNEEFVRTAPEDFSRIFAVEDPAAAQFYCHIFNDVDAYRKIPLYANDF